MAHDKAMPILPAAESFESTDVAYLNNDVMRDDGCTAVAAVLAGSRLLVANVGDSRAVLLRGGKGAQAACAHAMAGGTGI